MEGTRIFHVTIMAGTILARLLAITTVNAGAIGGFIVIICCIGVCIRLTTLQLTSVVVYRVGN